MLLHLLRHGQSTWNLERRLQGQTMDVPLTPLGVAQAEGARDALAHRRLMAVLSSDQVRALDTATVVATGQGLRVEPEPRLREVGLGALEGLRYDELVAEETPPGMDVSEVRWGGGESMADVAARLRPLLADLAGRFGVDDEVLVVSHGDTLKVLITLLDGGTHRDIDWDAWSTWPNGHIETRGWLGR
ncbi:probable phosphoglycerate mutase [Tessaracoccus bendigoensis DSM 12906]|uniref:Probable phosphoglycerate mutase n=1 Tax=Tessaracoccus bendigoensis DSM 12906 TaxID=1123357 RepID=A0A1M6LAX2_9ACTN|nr:histidine phosphatase family protein [Tessaracoccus bendigoensis]SHJ68346.1 probable phosphoglycerate mutase [Tessaracoccus bendigoensis DSM 12906]